MYNQNWVAYQIKFIWLVDIKSILKNNNIPRLKGEHLHRVKCLIISVYKRLNLAQCLLVLILFLTAKCIFYNTIRWEFK